MLTIRKLLGKFHKEKKILSEGGRKYCNISFYWNWDNSKSFHTFELLYTKVIAWFLLMTSTGVYMFHRLSRSILTVNAPSNTSSTHSYQLSSACLTLKTIALRSTEWCLLQIKGIDTKVYLGFTTSKFIINFNAKKTENLNNFL